MGLRRIPLCALLALPLTSCFPARQLETPTPIHPPSALITKHPPVDPAPASSSKPSSHLTPPHATRREIREISFVGVAFDSRNQRLVVADQPNGPGSQYADSASAALALGGIAAVNAGFFTPEGFPLGLVTSSGKISGTWNTASSLGGGIWYENASGGTAITRREKVGRSGAAAMRELIQAGPLLVENGHAISGLEATKSSARTLILWDGGTRWWIGQATTCTLAALGQALATGQPAGWVVRDALNLDGGRSADLWISDRVQNGPILKRPAWNRTVRNFLVLVEK